MIILLIQYIRIITCVNKNTHAVVKINLVCRVLSNSYELMDWGFLAGTASKHIETYWLITAEWTMATKKFILSFDFNHDIPFLRRPQLQSIKIIAFWVTALSSRGVDMVMWTSLRESGTFLTLSKAYFKV